MNEIKEIIKICKTLNIKLCLQYDTTFGLSAYYVSVLTTIHPLLITSKACNNNSNPFLIKLKNIYFSMKMKFQQIHIFYRANLYKMILILIYSKNILPKKVGKRLISYMLKN